MLLGTNHFPLAGIVVGEGGEGGGWGGVVGVAGVVGEGGGWGGWGGVAGVGWLGRIPSEAPRRSRPWPCAWRCGRQTSAGLGASGSEAPELSGHGTCLRLGVLHRLGEESITYTFLGEPQMQNVFFLFVWNPRWILEIGLDVFVVLVFPGKSMGKSREEFFIWDL